MPPYSSKTVDSGHPDIPVDETYVDYDDDDSATYSSGRTLASTITRYRYENGRRYHAFRDGEYYQPNDERQSNYEMIAHHLWLITLDDKLFLSPIENPQRVLDVGTGTGLWAIDMADAFPSADIIGTDLSPTQVTTAPPNIRFEIDDCCSQWTYPENSFDLVHMRSLSGCVSDWAQLYKQCFKHIEPNGYLEHLEFDVRNSANPSSTEYADKLYTQFTNLVCEAGNRLGKEFLIPDRMSSLMKEVGFTDVTEHKFIWPIGPWSSDPKLKEVGRWNQRNWEEGLEAWVLALFTRVMGWSYADVQKFVEDVKKVVRDRNCHYWHEVRVVYGRKPAEPQVVSGGTEGGEF